MAKVRGSHLGWEDSAADKYAQEWWAEHGYAFELKKRFQKKSEYCVQKDGITFDYAIANDTEKSSFGVMMDNFERHFETYKENQMLKKELFELQEKKLRESKTKSRGERE